MKEGDAREDPKWLWLSQRYLLPAALKKLVAVNEGWHKTCPMPEMPAGWPKLDRPDAYLDEARKLIAECEGGK